MNGSSSSSGQAGTGGGLPSPCASVPCKVMPLGDSITDGYEVPGGYRIKLWADIVGASKAINFVGSMQSGPPSLPDKDHEGHPGWDILQIDEISANAIATYQPDIILLHIGTNDILYTNDLVNAPARLAHLIDTIAATAPKSTLIVASIIPNADATMEADVEAYNAAIPGVVAAKAKTGYAVKFLDMHAAVGVGDLYTDGVHPIQSGYDKMADTWFPVLSALLP
jgi:lysophospholipase L1-like esterase